MKKFTNRKSRIFSVWVRFQVYSNRYETKNFPFRYLKSPITFKYRLTTHLCLLFLSSSLHFTEKDNLTPVSLNEVEGPPSFRSFRGLTNDDFLRRSPNNQYGSFVPFPTYSIILHTPVNKFVGGVCSEI